MGKNITIADVLKLSVTDRLQLVEDIWDSISSFPETISLTDSQKQQLDSRLDAYHRDPNSALPWKEVVDQIRQSA